MDVGVPKDITELRRLCEQQIEAARKHKATEGGELIFGDRHDYKRGGIDALEGVVSPRQHGKRAMQRLLLDMHLAAGEHVLVAEKGRLVIMYKRKHLTRIIDVTP